MGVKKIVVVTGANRGIGFAICEQILEKYGPVKLYACSRAGKDLGLQGRSHSEVTYPKLDITQVSQIQDLVSQIRSSDGRVDVLINNAGQYILNAKDVKEVEQMIQVNLHGTLSMCQTFLPLMSSERGRIVNLSSARSSLHLYSKSLQNRFRDPDASFADIDRLAREYVKAFEAGETGETDSPWGATLPYWVTKACVNAMTFNLARANPNVMINCCCPGWVASDMGQLVGDAPKSPADGAAIPLRLGFGDIGNVTGKYWANPDISDPGDGQVMPW